MRLDDLINTTLGRYQIEALVGRGGMAAVYRAYDPALQRPVALKVLYPQYLADADLVQRFRREAVTAARLDHPAIAPIYDVGDSNGLVYLALKLLPGPTLAEVLVRDGRLPPAKIVEIVTDLAAALDEAHQQGVIHRDVKPGNVLFDARQRAVLTDFGIAKSLDGASFTESSVIVGTPDYIAPEQIDPRLAVNGRIDGRADVYALGALIYRAITGRRPFEGSPQTVLLAQLRDDPVPPSTVVPSLPPAIDAVLARAMAKQPADRYATAGELARDLGLALSESTAIGTIFPPAALRQHPHQQVTTAAPVVALSAAPPLPAVVDQPAARPVPAAQRPNQSPNRTIVAVATLGLLVVLAIGLGRLAAQRQASQRTTGNASGANGGVVAAASTPTRTPRPSATTPPSPTLLPSPTATASAEPPSATLVATAEPTVVPTIAPISQAVLPTRPAPTRRPPSPTVRRSVPTAPPAPPTARPTLPPTPRPSATRVPPTPTPEPVGCAAPLRGGFGKLWNGNPAIQEALGCPLSAETTSPAAEQIFENGLMYWLSATQRIYVLRPISAGVWSQHTDTYIEGELLDLPPAPAGQYVPIRGFGKLWITNDVIRDSLGWGLTPEAPLDGVYQRFQRGIMLYSWAIHGHSPRIYVLLNNGTSITVNDQ